MKRTKDTPSSSIPRITRSKAAYSNATRIVSAEFLEEDTFSEQVTPNIPTRLTEQDVIESSSQHLGDDSSIAEKEKGLTSEPRRTRGPTRCKDIWTLSEGEKIPIGTNDFGQPVSERTSNLSHFLGTMIRQRGLLNGTDWRLVNKTIKDDMWEDVKNVEEVFLKSWIEADLVVGSGIIVSRESNKIVGGVELGDYFYEVSIEIPIQPLVPLIRPYGNLKTIGDAVGRTIAWLRTHVERKGA